MSDATTHNIRVQVTPVFLPEQSSPERHTWVFAYQVVITNLGDQPARLVGRHWIITDGLGRVEEVEGSGVIGQQPRIEPGESFTYTSGCPLPTEVGTMQGRYRMVRDDGEPFEVTIAPFTLATPNALN